jgi:hypothetical protein
MKGQGELESYRARYVPPRDAALEHTSGWANYFGERDTSARMREARQAAGGQETEPAAGGPKEIARAPGTVVDNKEQQKEDTLHGKE